MGKAMIYFAWVGVFTALGFIALDFGTALRGVRIILGAGPPQDPFAFFIPVFIAMGAIVFNGLSGRMFQLYLRDGWGNFSTIVTLLLWISFLSYDVISSFVGMLDTYSGMKVDSIPSIMEAIDRMSFLAKVILTLVSFSLSLGPFMFCIFYELTQNKNEKK